MSSIEYKHLFFNKLYKIKNIINATLYFYFFFLFFYSTVQIFVADFNFVSLNYDFTKLLSIILI